MSRTDGDRGWVVTLLLLALVTAGCVVAYLAAPFDPPPSEEVGRTSDHVVPPEHRIVAIRDDGSLVLLDARDGALSEVVVPGGLGGVDTLDVGHHRETAYLGRTDGTISVVRLRTGEEDALASGRLPDVGPLAFPQLDADIERPEVEQQAFVTSRDGVDRITVENLTTGSTAVFAADRHPPPFREIDDLAWSPFENVLFGIADGGSVLFRLDVDRAESLDGAQVSDPLPEGDRWVDATVYGDGLAVILRSGAGTEIVEVDGRRLERSGSVFRPDTGTRLAALDADAALGALLITTRSGDLLRLSRGEDDPAPISCCVSRAAW